MSHQITDSETELFETNQLGILKDITDNVESVNIGRRNLDPGKGRKGNIRSIEEALKDVEDETVGKSKAVQGSVDKPDQVLLEDAIRREKKIKVIKGKIDEVESSVEDMKNTISLHTKNFDYQVDISKDGNTKKAVRKVFKKSLSYINKDMYLYAVKRLQEIQMNKLDEEITKESTI
mgnify:CR=1 FL=1